MAVLGGGVLRAKESMVVEVVACYPKGTMKDFKIA
jgi:hypothetical protein